MPEGDSVYKLARRLDRSLLGRTVLSSELRVPRLATRDLSGRTVVEHATHGKHLLTRFSGGVTLHSHLRMDGEWSVTGPGKRLPRRLMPDVRLVLGLDDGRTAWGLRLHDLELVATHDEASIVGHLGPDPLRDDWDAEEAVARLRARPDTPLVTALLDQTLMAGLGNLWANELAFLTGVSPWTPVGEVDVDRLVARAATALRHSATVQGAYQVTTGLTPPRRGPLGRRPRAAAVPALRHGGARGRRAAERPRQPAHVVVSPVPAGPWAGGASSRRSPAHLTRRILIGPLAVDGSTTLPPWVTSTSPAATSRRAARRAGSIRGRQSSSSLPGATARAASLGQMVAPRSRCSSSSRMVASRASSVRLTPRRRQESEQ